MQQSQAAASGPRYGRAAGPVVVWRLVDGKPGHDSQSRGLVNALGRLVPTDVHEVAAAAAGPALRDWLRRRFPAGRGLPDPDLVVGAGHATHLPVLAARRARGGRAVVLMRPSLPRGLFDLCIVPAHDRVRSGSGVLVTRGAINTVRPSERHRPEFGLVLAGGPSRHYHWNDETLAAELRRVVRTQPRVRFTLTTSRRTPASFLPVVRALGLANLDVVPASETPPGWVAERLAEAGQVWVTEDSVSMVYEALTAAAAVGLLEVRVRRRTRVVQGMADLVAEGWVTPFSAWCEGARLAPPGEPFNEAERCAHWIRDRWLRGR